MDDTFITLWLKGFAEGLESLPPEMQRRLLVPCGKRCAESGMLALYQKHCSDCHRDPDAYYQRLHELGAMSAEVLQPGTQYLVHYPECLCDLHTSGGVNTPALCECSRQSLLYVTRQVMETDRVSVECLGSILSGAPECTFRITFD